MRTRPASVSVFLFAGALAGCHKAVDQPVAASEAAAVRAGVLRLESQAFAATVAITGTLISTSRVEIKAETTGRVVRFPKEEGDRVTQGEPVVWVDDANHRLAAAQAESAVKVAEAALERARVGEAHAISELERARNLVRSGGITDRDLKAAELAQRDASAQVGLLAAQLDQARASLETARKHLRDAVIHAPVAGEIQRKHLNPGAYVEPPTAVFSLVDNSRLELECQVAASDLAPLRPGQPVDFTVNSYPGTKFRGRLIEVNPAVDPDARSAKVRIHVDNASGKLKAGMFAEGEILTGIERQAIVIPSTALYRDDRSAKEAFVFVVENERAVRRPVRIGGERNSTIEILAGLRPGDLLIAEQSIELGEGVRIQPR